MPGLRRNHLKTFVHNTLNAVFWVSKINCEEKTKKRVSGLRRDHFKSLCTQPTSLGYD